MPLSAAAKRLVSLFRGIPADKKEEIGKAFDAKHAKELLKFEREALANAALELKDVNFSDKKKEDEKKAKKKKKKLKEDLVTIVNNFIVEDANYERFTRRFLERLPQEHWNRHLKDEKIRLTSQLNKAKLSANPNVVGAISAEHDQVHKAELKLKSLDAIKNDLASRRK